MNSPVAPPTARRSGRPYRHLRAVAALADQVPHLGVVVTSEDEVRSVGSFVDGPDQIHPSEFRDLVIASLEANSLDLVYWGLGLPAGQPVDVRLVTRSDRCRARPGGLISIAGSGDRGDSVGGSRDVYVFATDLWWPDTVSVLLDETITARLVSSRLGELDHYLDLVQDVSVDSVFDDLLSISLISLRYRHTGHTGADTALVLESIAMGLAERLESLSGM
jgi:hypothetical protein